MKNPLKIAVLSFADIDNFGDILFAHVVEGEIKKIDNHATIDFFSPTDYEHADRIYKSFDCEEDYSEYDAILLAGGEVIHFYDERTWLPIYEKRGFSFPDDRRPSDIIWKFHDKKQVAYKAWLSVGVRECKEIEDGLLEKVIQDLDFISVRGLLSKKILEKKEFNFYDRKIRLTPDLGWLFPETLTRNSHLSSISHIVELEEPYIIFQTNNISDDDCQLITKELMKVKQNLHLNIVLLPVIRPWDDLSYLKKIEHCSKGSIKCLPNNLNAFQIMKVILGAKFVISSSLHCALTALAADIPAGLINKWQGSKLQDIFSQQFRMDFLSSDYNDIYYFSERLAAESKSDKEILSSFSSLMRLHLRKLFQDLVSDIRNST